MKLTTALIATSMVAMMQRNAWAEQVLEEASAAKGHGKFMRKSHHTRAKHGKRNLQFADDASGASSGE